MRNFFVVVIFAGMAKETAEPYAGRSSSYRVESSNWRNVHRNVAVFLSL